MPWMPGYLHRRGERDMALNLYDPPYRVRGDTGADYGTAIQNAVNDANGIAFPGFTTAVEQPSGLLLTSKQIVIPSQVIYRGTGFGSTLRMAPTFPINTALVRLGAGDLASVGNNGYFLERIVLDCAGRTGSIGLYSNQLNEVSGIRDFAILNHMKYGIHVQQTGLGAYNFKIQDGTIVCNGLATLTEGIRIENSTTPGASMNADIMAVSVVPAAGAVQQSAGVHLLATATLTARYVLAFLYRIHVEHVVDGVFFDHESMGHVKGIEGANVVGSCVRINNDSAWTVNPFGEVVVENALNNGGGVAITDVINGYTSPARKGFYSTSSVLVGGSSSQVSGRFQEATGANVVATNNLTLGNDGNQFGVTGATQINLLDSTGWQDGAVVTLFFNSNPLVKNNQGASGAFKPFELNAAGDFQTQAFSTLTVRLLNGFWMEIGRKV